MTTYQVVRSRKSPAGHAQDRNIGPRKATLGEAMHEAYDAIINRWIPVVGIERHETERHHVRVWTHNPFA